MGTSDGTLHGSAKIVDHGPDEDRWNLVLTGDGFTDLVELEQVADDFVAFLQTSAASPLSASATWNSVNVHRIDVSSHEEGTDSPNCDGTTVATYFDSTLCGNGLDRLLIGADDIVIATADAEVPEWDAIVVFVNTKVYGGSGGLDSGIAWAALDDANAVALHELGHAAFNLHDEYCNDGSGVYSGSEPTNPNVTTATTLAALKWSAQVTPGTSIPTSTNPDPTGAACDTAPSPVPAGTVGTFEGAMYTAVGLFRPEYDCLMRTLGVPWCQVCSDAVLARVDEDKGGGPCWVAAVAYGDPQHPDVAALRGWRDRRLAAGSRSMRTLTAVYARVGPVLARLTAGRPRVNTVLREAVLRPWAGAVRRRSRRNRDR